MKFEIGQHAYILQHNVLMPGTRVAVRAANQVRDHGTAPVTRYEVSVGDARYWVGEEQLGLTPGGEAL